MQRPRLDPRTKLALQAALAVAAFEHTTPRGLAVTTALVGVAVLAVGVSPVGLLRPYVVLLPFLVAGPLFAVVRLRPPWLVLGDAVTPALAGYRTVVLVTAGALYVRTTPVRESEAAIQRLLPGRVGRLLGIAVGLVFRFLPLVRRELSATRNAMRVRLGTEQPVHERISRLLIGTLTRTLRRADRLGLALRARCLSWNPTLPEIRFSWVDAPGLLVAAALVAWTVL